MTKRIVWIFTVLLVAVLCFALFACDKDGGNATVDYSIDNAYAYETSEDDEAVHYEPTGVTADRGMIFYVGTAIAPEYYSYLGDALAKQGYVVVFPKSELNMTYVGYQETEAAYAKYPDVKFFIGGHSQGGGAAIKRAEQQKDSALGLVLFAPLSYTVADCDENGNKVIVRDSVADTALPTLLIEASEDHVLTDVMKAESKTRLPEGYEYLMIEGGCHMCFSTLDDDGTLSFFGDGPLTGITKDGQREATVAKTLAFLKSCAK